MCVRYVFKKLLRLVFLLRDIRRVRVQSGKRAQPQGHARGPNDSPPRGIPALHISIHLRGTYTSAPGAPGSYL